MQFPLTEISVEREVEVGTKALAGVTGTVNSFLYLTTGLSAAQVETVQDIQTNGTLVGTIFNNVAVSTTETVAALNTNMQLGNNYILLNQSIVDGDTKWVAISLTTGSTIVG